MSRFHISIPPDIAEDIKDMGVGSLSSGVVLLYRESIKTRNKGHAHKPADAEPERPFDPRNPRGDQRIQNGLDNADRKAAEAAEAEAKRLASLRVYYRDWFKEYLRTRGNISFILESEDFINKKLPDEWSDIHYLLTQEEIDECMATYRAQPPSRPIDLSLIPDLVPVPQVQTLRLTHEALKHLGLFGTPEAMTDAQIAETNAAYSDMPAGPGATLEDIAGSWEDDNEGPGL